ncbi:MAG: hypothetical protein IKQ60_02645 [Candidatus Methanomethylophilaceae archaeon]|nr:hypothetical protein [Candidatus Methanomethylophilaceae archaeon]
MDSKVLYAIIAVAVIAIAAVAALALLNNGGSSDDADHTGKSFDDTRLRIYGNANGDDLIDKADLSTINWIIKSNKDSDSSKHVDWAKDYPLADANYDGKVDDKDSAVVQDIIDKKKTRMYYYNKYERVTYVNYPISDKIGAEYLILQLLPAIKSYSMLKAIDDTTPSIYNNVYPGVDKMPVMGTWREITIESLTDLYNKGTIGTFMQWTGGQNVDYIWDKAVASGLSEKMSFVIVPCQGPDVIQGVLELACMLGNQSLSDDYRKWYDSAMEKLDSIEDKIAGGKKTVTAVRCYNDKVGSMAAFGSSQGPALWFNKVIRFQPDYVGKTNFTTIGSVENFVSSATDEVVVMFQKNCDWSEFNDLVDRYLTAVYGTTDQFKHERMYAIDFEIMPFAAGPAGCYILAAYLYPELFKMDEALDFLQVYLDDFAVRIGANARQGYTYTGPGYSS